MYIIFLLTIIILSILLYSFDIEANITIISCVIIILLLNSIINKKSYEKFNSNILEQQEKYNSTLEEIKKRYYSFDNVDVNSINYTKIPVYSSDFQWISDFKEESTCVKDSKSLGLPLTNNEFVKILNKIQTINNPN
jgi:hypothetical protein